MTTSDENDGRCLIDIEAWFESIDVLVKLGGFRSRSALAIAAGFDPSTLNISKGRWPILSTILRLCQTVEFSIVDWALIYQDNASRRAGGMVGYSGEEFRGAWADYAPSVRQELAQLEGRRP